MTPPNKFLPLIPVLPQENIVQEGGGLHPAWQNFFSNLIISLQNNFSHEGYQIPVQTEENVTSINANKSNFLIIDGTNNLLKVNLGGTLKTITTS